MQDMRNELCQLRGVVCKYVRGEKHALLAFLLCHDLYLSLL